LFELECPKCGHRLRISGKYAGQQGRCKYCKAVIQVPNLPEGAEAEPASSALADLNQQPGRQHQESLAVETREYRPLGCLFWIAALFLTPVAVIWAFLLPKGHPRKPMAILVTLVLLLLVPVIFFGVVIGGPAVVLLLADGKMPGVSEFKIAPNPVQIEMAQSPQATVQIGANEEDAWSISWHSSDSTIAAIEGDGLRAQVTALSPGTVTIRAVNNSTDQQTTAQVIVTGAGGASPAQAGNEAQQPAPPTPQPAPALAAGQSPDALVNSFPLAPGLQFAVTSDVPTVRALEGSDPSSLHIYSGTVGASCGELHAFYKERLEDTDWDYYQRTLMEAPEVFFFFEGGLDAHIYYLYGKPEGDATRVWLVLEPK
jgi:hypothetical protein